MRLSRQEIAAISRVLGARLKNRSAALYLFGSRTQNQLKGGDIDLLVLAPATVAKDLRAQKHFLLAEFKEELGDQRIDLTLAEPAKARKDPFLARALRTAVLLKRWGSVEREDRKC
jgi:predicted nucleotidyltransferase